MYHFGSKICDKSNQKVVTGEPHCPGHVERTPRRHYNLSQNKTPALPWDVEHQEQHSRQLHQDFAQGFPVQQGPPVISYYMMTEDK